MEELNSNFPIAIIKMIFVHLITYNKVVPELDYIANPAVLRRIREMDAFQEDFIPTDECTFHQ